ncbi:site-specific integrase [Hymenobacter psychrophilus]|uniref:Site-specific recombinase XerD n=1 Tax=Hymenobacter psychrophilus TaxID=651662 RepID=A0A1H3DNY0_9BACT|nr:site-specific integrase [Hymenobacter psychrophilus]SDX68050.1 Site-specific recombinase XerD [Hymenobacter psychrophilus]
MLRTKYYLTDPQTESTTAIYAACYLNGKRKKLYTPLSVSPIQWDSKAQQFRKNFTSFSDANKLLRRLIDELDAHHFAMAAKGQATTIDSLHGIIVRVLTGAVPEPVTFVDHINNWLESSKRDMKPSTVKGYVTFRNHLVAFSKAKHYKLEFSTLDVAFSETFKNYLLKTVNLTNTSVNNVIKNLKVFLSVTHSQGLHEFQYHTRFRKLDRIEPEVVYLTTDEKAAIANLNLDYILRWERTRDVFVFECETGLRFSDVAALRPDQVHKDHLILVTQKTEDLLKIPLSPLAQSILKKYAGKQAKALPVKTNQKTNADLKQIAKLAKLEAHTSTSKLRGKDKVITVQPKWQLVCTHTARRTFVTLALQGGMRPEVVMRITGHKNIKTLFSYLKINDVVVMQEFGAYLNREARL